MRHKMTDAEKASRAATRCAISAADMRRHEEEKAAFRAAAPGRILTLMARATAQDVTFTVAEVKGAEPNRYLVTFKLPGFDGRDWDNSNTITTHSDEWDFQTVETEFKKMEELRAEEERQKQVRKAALEKVRATLTEEEIKLLGVRTY